MSPWQLLESYWSLKATGTTTIWSLKAHDDQQLSTKVMVISHLRQCKKIPHGSRQLFWCHNYQLLYNTDELKNYLDLKDKKEWLVLKGVPHFAPWQARLKTPQLGEAKPTTRGVRLGRLNVRTSLLGGVINLCLFVWKENKTWNPNLLKYIRETISSSRKAKSKENITLVILHILIISYELKCCLA